MLVIFANNKDYFFTSFGNLGSSFNQAREGIFCELLGFSFIEEDNHFGLVLDRNRWDFIDYKSLTIKTQSEGLNQNRWGTLIEYVFAGILLNSEYLLKVIEFRNCLLEWLIRILTVHIFKWKFGRRAVIALWLSWMRIAFTW